MRGPGSTGMPMGAPLTSRSKMPGLVFANVRPACRMRGRSVALKRFLMALAVRPFSSGTISTHLLPAHGPGPVRPDCRAGAHAVHGATGSTHVRVARDDDAVLLVGPGALVHVFVNVVEKPLAALARGTSFHNARYQAPVHTVLAQVARLQRVSGLGFRF